MKSFTHKRILEILTRNHWVPANASLSEGTLRERLEAYARFHGLNPTVPDLADLVVEHAKQPRCALPDLSTVFDPTEPIRRASGGCRWPHKEIRVWHDMTFANVPKGAVDQCWRAALASWEAVCGIRFVFHPTQQGANIFAHAKRIDGPSNVLAWSMLPCGVGANGSCEQRYDLEPWPSYGTDWRGLQEVMAHELGHAIGIDHLASGNLMQPFATFRTVVPQQGDIAEAQARYGPPQPQEEPSDPAPGDPVPPSGGAVLLGHWTMTTPYNGHQYRLVLIDDGA